MAKRFLSAIVGILILFLVFISNNQMVLNIAITIISLIGVREFYNAFKDKEIHPIKFIGYLASLLILPIGYVPLETLRMIAILVVLPVSVLALFCSSIFTNIKYNIVDISVTFFCVIYVTFLSSFLSLTRALENGQYIIWYILAGAWVTDTFAYLVGVKFGKHKFSQISPKKSIEGCVGGILGCMAFFGGFSYFLNTLGMELNILALTLIGLVISVFSQIGDFAASSIKRFCGIKDFGTIMPGHGGVLDRFDSVIMIAPFIYAVFQLL